MKLFKIILCFLVGLFGVTACNVKKQVVQTQQQEVFKEVEKIVSYKDTTLFVPGSKAQLIIYKSPFKSYLNKGLSKVDKDTVYQKKQGNAKLTVQKIGNQLVADCECDTIAIQAKLKDTYTSKKIIDTTTDSVSAERTKGVPVFDLIIYIMASLSIGFVGGYLLRTFKRI